MRTQGRWRIPEAGTAKTFVLRYGSRILASRLTQQALGDLQTIECRALAKLVSDYPEVQGIRVREILTDAAHNAVVLAFDGGRHRVAIFFRRVPDLQSGELAKSRARGFGTHRLLCLRIDCDGVRGENRHSNRCG